MKSADFTYPEAYYCLTIESCVTEVGRFRLLSESRINEWNNIIKEKYGEGFFVFAFMQNDDYIAAWKIDEMPAVYAFPLFDGPYSEICHKHSSFEDWAVFWLNAAMKC